MNKKKFKVSILLDVVFNEEPPQKALDPDTSYTEISNIKKVLKSEIRNVLQECSIGTNTIVVEDSNEHDFYGQVKNIRIKVE